MPLVEHLPLIVAMFVLVTASAFFSCSEAAFFSLTRQQRSAMSRGTDAERAAVDLLRRPDRLLTAILFGNLMLNLTYYGLSSIVVLRLQREHPGTPWGAGFAAVSLAIVVVCSELGPKNVGVLNPRWIASIVCFPLALVARALDPIVPVLRGISDALARLFVPRIKPEPYLELADLERAVELGGGDALDGGPLVQQERQVLQRIFELAEGSAAELMRPRRRCVVLRPPVSLIDVPAEALRGDFVLVTEPDTDEIAAAIAVDRLALLPPDRLERHADPVAVVPWSASASTVLTQLRDRGRRVAAVVNELGETIGIVTLERLLDAVLRDATRIDPQDAHAARLRQLPGGAWEVAGSTPLRRVAKRLGLDDSDEFGEVRSVTVAGLLQEVLERSPRFGDRIRFAGYDWAVTTGPPADGPVANEDTPITVRVRETDDSPAPPAAEGPAS
ncbi:MAG: CNNM domain-containing protein [Lacipirellulaceae bacterium]